MNQLAAFFTELANAIRAKSGKNDAMTPEEMANEIREFISLDIIDEFVN